MIHEPAIFLVVIGIIFGIIFVFINPPGFGLDERAHFMRAYEVSTDKFGPTKVGDNHHPGAYLPKNLTEFVNNSTADLSDNNVNASIFSRHDFEASRYGSYFSQPFSKDKVDDFVSNAQLTGTFTYNPVGYLHLALPILISRVADASLRFALYFTRLTNLIIYLALTFIAVRIIPRYKWLLVMVALWPTALFQASIVSVDPIINAASFLLIAFMFDFWYREMKIEIWKSVLIILLLSFLALTKFPYVLLALPFLTTSSRLFTSSRHSYIWRTAWVVVPLVIGLVWAKADADTVREVASGFSPLNNVDAQQHFIIHHPLETLAITLRTFYEGFDGLFGSMVGRIGDRMVGLPYVLIAFFAALTVGMATLYGYSDKVDVPERAKRAKVAIWLTILGILLGISLSLYLVFTPVARKIVDGIQGRYFLPLVPLFMIMVVPLTRLKLAARSRNIELLMTLASIVLLATTCIVYTLVNY